MPMLLTEEPNFLKEGQRVKFSENWSEETKKAGKFFKAKKTVRTVKKERYWILDTDSTVDFRIDEDSGLLPTTSDTLYEVHVGMKGDVLLYPMWPESDYLLELEKVGQRPYTSADQLPKRYLGNWDQYDIGWKDKRLTDYFVKNMDRIVYRLYNDSPVPEKVVLRFMVNKIVLEEIGKKKPYRYLPHHEDYSTG